MKPVEIKVKGIKCDNQECGYRNDTVRLEDFDKWLNAPCPNCGSNLLTQKDFDTIKVIVKLTKIFNNPFVRIPYGIFNWIFNGGKHQYARAHMNGSGSIKIEKLKEGEII